MPLIHRGRLELAISPSTVRVARHWTAKQLDRPVSGSGQAASNGQAVVHGQAALDAEVVDAAVLAVSELVTNAVRAVRQANSASVTLPGRLSPFGNEAALAVPLGRPQGSASPSVLTGITLLRAPPSVSLVISRFVGVLRIDVHDSSPVPLPPACEHDPDDENGRGLTVVAAIAERWGWRPERFGKVVWCELAVAPGHAEPDRGR
ncbi:MAG: ATP-binding protein [Nocardiopsaceae bacterium]|nr:ATP-binding protein [Nocardiopsaceae bacterium]